MARTEIMARTAIWAFGVVMYEMVIGQPLFGGGETMSDILAAVMTREPDWTSLPKGTPGPVRRLLKRCLVEAKNRLCDIGEARIALEEAGAAAPEAAQAPHSRSFSRAAPWTIAAAATAIAAFMLWHGAGRQPGN